MDKTSLYNVSLIKREAIAQTLKEVYAALEERGYNPVNQIVGYLISGDPGYISSYKDARSKMVALDRSEVVMLLLLEFI
ncbi:MAG: IreB family regulatory phosphoprotein [Bacilli bacterium]|nr:IreB family regulatory phosphoprotein [Bacilli bacterium]